MEVATPGSGILDLFLDIFWTHSGQVVNQPGADVFETICSFANRQGGNLLLSVLDDGSVEGDCFEAFVPVPDVAVGRKPDGDGVSDGPESTSAEVREAVGRLLARHGSFAASELSREVTSVGERTIRRYLAKMVADGELRVVSGGRATRYTAGSGDSE